MFALQSVTIELEDKLLLKDFCLKTQPGEIICILGQNGVGKSSLLKAVAGIGELNITGDIMIHGQVISSLSANERYHAGILLLYQAPPVLEGVTVFQLLRAIVDKKVSTTELLSQIKTLAKEVELPEDLYTKVVNQDLSGGQKKLLELLQAMLLKPKVLLCDEIDSGLDITKQKIVIQVLTRLAKEDMIILCVTHSLSQARELNPSRVVLLSKNSYSIGGAELIQQVEKHGYTQD
jgi:Fe-S cluster assembly ATP-binding protein